MKKILILSLLVVTMQACKQTPKPTEVEGVNGNNQNVEKWGPNDSTLMSPSNDMKTWNGKEVKNTSIVGSWRIENEAQKDLILKINKEGKFSLSIPNDIDNETLGKLKKYFSQSYDKGNTYEGFLKCYDIWCAGGEGPDASCAVGFFDSNDNLMNYYAFVYCQINDNEFSLDEIEGSGIIWYLHPIPLRKFKKLKFPDDYE